MTITRTVENYHFNSAEGKLAGASNHKLFHEISVIAIEEHF